MAFFLLIYVFICIYWLVRSVLLTLIIFKHRFPGREVIYGLATFWLVSLVIFFISYLFISAADWKTVPEFIKALGA